MHKRTSAATFFTVTAFAAVAAIFAGPMPANADAWLSLKFTVAPPSVDNMETLAVDPATHTVYTYGMSSSGSNAILAIDGTTGQVTRTIPFASAPYGANLALDSSAKILYVACPSGTPSGGNSVSIIDLTTGQVLATITGAAVDYAWRIAVDPTTHDAFVSNLNSSQSASVAVIDGTTHQVKASIPDPSLVDSTTIAFNPVNKLVYVANGGSASISGGRAPSVTVVDPATSAVVKVLSGPALDGVVSLAVDDSTGQVYVANWPFNSSSSIAEIDGTSNTVSRTFSSGLIGDLQELAVDDATGTLLVVGGGAGSSSRPQVVSVDVATGAARSAYAISNGMETDHVAIDETTRLAYTVNSSPNNPAQPDTVSVFGLSAVPASARISAPDRFANSVAIAQAAFPATAPVVYVATGFNYPDALGAGAAAASAGGPLLLTTPTELPSSVKSEIQSLSPSKIVVVGGPNSVSDGVFSELQTLAPTVTRQGGADRYEASRNIVAGQFTHATTAFIATGANFPDALSATSAAASKNAPVILVPGTNQSLDAPTLSLLTSLGVTDVTITGGPNSVSPAIETQLDNTYGANHVTRLGGADRYEASTNINNHFFTSATQAYIATGSNFPDALAGGVLAANKTAPLLVVHSDCIPASAINAMAGWGVTKVTLIGGPASLNASVANLEQCA